MRMSRLFGKTLRNAPAEAETPNHQLMLRAGLVQQLAAGIYSYLPVGWRVMRKIEQIIREEMDRAGGQEVVMPALQPAELWEQSGRARDDGATCCSTSRTAASASSSSARRTRRSSSTSSRSRCRATATCR